MLKYDKKTIQNLTSNLSSCSEDEKHSQDKAMDEINPEDMNNQYEVLPYMKKIITMNINEKDDYNEYRFGNIIISRQVDFIYYFWLALSLCHEVISVSKSKQNMRKLLDDEALIFHSLPSKQSSQMNYMKKSTHDYKVDHKIVVPKTSHHDDFQINSNPKLLDSDSLSEEYKENANNENQKNDEVDSISELEIEDTDELVYHGMSPDEITLVNAAKDVGFEFRYRSNKEIEIKLGGVKKIYKLLKMFPFTSERKRMTILVQDPEDPDFVIAFTKGADNVMKALSLERYNSHLNFDSIEQFAKKGYRTLLIGMKVIRFDEFKEWEEAYDEINKELDNKNKEELEQLVYLIERDLFLLGTTALEDKLQENVHECIEEFRRADIKVWMITGDKLETAENIGIS